MNILRNKTTCHSILLFLRHGLNYRIFSVIGQYTFVKFSAQFQRKGVGIFWFMKISKKFARKKA
nr:MAG TPA_asm: hypothetical protein [Caudoviricetes sp.]